MDDLNSAAAACTGADGWPFVFLGGILFAHVLTRVVKSIRHTVSVALAILSIQVFVFNVLHVSCYWAWWGNALADTVIAGLILFRLLDRPSYLLQILLAVTVVKISWSLAWFFQDVGSFDYAYRNNQIWGVGFLTVLAFAIYDIYRSLWPGADSYES